ncbi:ADP-ribosylation factor GTPase-activating protein 2 [Thrips palmi]|uniref:ADP-ribosylation factor GTPase-activating protein 2 n=1 Tax=Thrips palmi TaxID=161013 RepID=A0A6P8ZXW6_THRPL|nr:ADP-ribosylation factor GTPase-activating protein 2 [Thrips palmi]
MAEQQAPSKNDIQAILKRLRSQGPNKVCFDCSSKNPTWATVTYGVFICIDCSAVHRSLGVHLTFVRSTQLDTNWTWLQLRQMQLGGNANAHTFFQQHNCTTNDANHKYNSRAAQLYREKLHSAAIQAMKVHGTKLIIDPTHDAPIDEPAKEVDFFEEHEKLQLTDDNSLVAAAAASVTSTAFHSSVPDGAAANSAGQPSVLGILSPASVPDTEVERKHIIGSRKPVAKKSGLGAKKGLGAQRVKTNFSEIEQKAAMADQMKETAAHEAKIQAERTAEEEEKQLASMRLAYQDLSIAQKKEEEIMRTTDPKKATQMERLGMGFTNRSAVSHSAMNDMQTIEQDAPVKKSSASYGSFRKSMFDRDIEEAMQQDRGYVVALMRGAMTSLNDDNDNVNWDSESESDREKELELEREHKLEVKRERKRERDREMEQDRPRERESERDLFKNSSSSSRWEKSSTGGANSRSYDSTPTGNEAQKKFGAAKAISSDQYFADSDANSWERKANLSRFEGSTGISSADYFGNGSSSVGSPSGYGGQMSSPDLEDVKESVRQGVTKVAGKLSSLANGVMSSLQERYGGY